MTYNLCCDILWTGRPARAFAYQAAFDKMLDMGKVTTRDYVIDLGSGDGRNVIAAAKRGSSSHGTTTTTAPPR